MAKIPGKAPVTVEERAKEVAESKRLAELLQAEQERAASEIARNLLDEFVQYAGKRSRRLVTSIKAAIFAIEFDSRKLTFIVRAEDEFEVQVSGTRRLGDRQFAIDQFLKEIMGEDL
jgi:hypothetical protein